MELINLELKFATKNLNPQINLPLNFFIQKYFFHDSPYLEYKLFAVGIPSIGTRRRYSEHLLMVKRVGKHRIGIDKLNVEFTKWN